MDDVHLCLAAVDGTDMKHASEGGDSPRNSVEQFPVREDVTEFLPDDPKRIRVGWVVYEEIGVAVINEYVFHRYPPLVKWLMFFAPFSFLQRLCREHREPGLCTLRPAWLFSVASWRPLNWLARPVWRLMGKPGENQGLIDLTSTQDGPTGT